MADRIEAGTFMLARGITNGDITLENCPIDAMLVVKDKLSAMGVNLAVSGSDLLRHQYASRTPGPFGRWNSPTQPHRDSRPICRRR